MLKYVFDRTMAFAGLLVFCYFNQNQDAGRPGDF